MYINGVNDALMMVLILLGIATLITVIILVLKLISVASKVDNLLDNVNNKVSSLDGVFDGLNFVSNKISTFGIVLVEKVGDMIGNFLSKKKEEE